MKTAFLFFLTIWFCLSFSQAETRKQTEPVHIVALGDSLMAGFGLDPAQGIVPRLEKALAAKYPNTSLQIINAGIAGDTSSQGLARLDWAVPDGTSGVLLELGANDALRAQDPAETEKALDAILSRLQTRKISVFFIGMLAPPNLGDAYQEQFNGLFPRLAEKYGVAFYPFFLDGVAGNTSLNQQDGMHPNEQGVGIILDRMLPSLSQWLESEVFNNPDNKLR